MPIVHRIDLGRAAQQAYREQPRIGNANGKWVIDSGAYTILVGKNADDAETAASQGRLTVQGD